MASLYHSMMNLPQIIILSLLKSIPRAIANVAITLCPLCAFCQVSIFGSATPEQGRARRNVNRKTAGPHNSDAHVQLIESLSFHWTVPMTSLYSDNHIVPKPLMEAHGLVSPDPSWTWVVEKQCFISWTDKEEGPKCLGELSPRNFTVKLSINIGWSADSKEMLMALHLPILSRGSKHARDMFMIIPNTFDTSTLDTTFAPIQNADLDNAEFAYCNLFHFPVTVAENCDVIMPQTQRQKPLRGTPQVLVSKLKSLSEARAFDIYCRFDTFAQVELRKIFARIDHLDTPSLLLDSMYDGRGAGINLWHHQGLHPAPENGQPREEPQQDPSLPPPYTSHVTPPPVDVQVPCSEVIVNPVSKSMDSAEDGVPESPFWLHMRRILDYKSPQWEAAQRVTEKRPASIEPLPNQRRVKRIGICRTPPIRSSVHEFHALTKEPDDAFIDSQHDAFRRVEQPEGVSSSLIAATPASLPPQSDESTVDEHHDASLSIDRSEEIARWLYSAWKVLPSAHHELRSHLLSLGATRDTASFANLRVDISTALAFAAARTPERHFSQSSLLTYSDAEHGVKEVVQWINSVRSDADTALVYDLATLAGAAMDVVDSVSEKEEKIEAFLLQKARCIAFAGWLGAAVTTV
jgi:hypothetical protein